MLVLWSLKAEDWKKSVLINTYRNLPIKENNCPYNLNKSPRYIYCDNPYMKYFLTDSNNFHGSIHCT